MTFLQKLDLLMEQNNVNKHTLSKQCGIPYTTIDGFYKKGYANVKLSTLQRLCAYFSVSLDYLVKDDAVQNSPDIQDLTESEIAVILAYRTNTEMQPAIDKILGIYSYSDDNDKE